MKMLLSMPRSHTPAMAESRHIGTIRIIASGRVQLSYCAANVRKTNSTHNGKDVRPPCCRRAFAGGSIPSIRRKRNDGSVLVGEVLPSVSLPCPPRRAGGHVAHDVGGGVEVVARHTVRAGGLRDLGDGASAAPSGPRCCAS